MAQQDKDSPCHHHILPLFLSTLSTKFVIKVYFGKSAHARMTQARMKQSLCDQSYVVVPFVLSCLSPSVLEAHDNSNLSIYFRLSPRIAACALTANRTFFVPGSRSGKRLGKRSSNSELDIIYFYLR